MKHTIYIRKENEGVWDLIEDKSAWVNDLIRENGSETLGYQQKHAQVNHAKQYLVANDEMPKGGPKESLPKKEVAQKCEGHSVRMNCGKLGCKY